MCNLYVQTHSIGTIRRTLQTSSQKPRRAHSTIIRWFNNLNNLENGQIRLVEGGFQLLSKQCKKVNSYSTQHPQRTLNRAVADFRISTPPFRISWKSWFTCSSTWNQLLHQTELQDFAHPIAFSQSTKDDMYSSSSFLVEWIFLMNVSLTPQD